MAANRTAEFARTGVFPTGDDSASKKLTQVQRQHASRQAGTSNDSSHNSTDSAEEVGYEPTAAKAHRQAHTQFGGLDMAAGAPRLPPLSTHSTGAQCQAGAQLLTLDDDDGPEVAMLDAMRNTDLALQEVMGAHDNDQGLQVRGSSRGAGVERG